MKVPLLDLKLQYASLKDEIASAIGEVLERQQFILGPKGEAFEREMADYLGVPYALGVSSGTDALLLSLMALGVGRGDVVITSPFTFFATAGSISRLGATPLFVDIDPLTYTLSPEKTEEVVSSLKRHQRKKLKAIIPVHLYGQCADMEGLMEIAQRYHLRVVEDAAQAVGAQQKWGGASRHAGSLGTCGCFSFFPTKNLGGYGEGGLVVTHDGERAETIRSLRHHGCRSQQEQYYYDLIGINGRLDELQAAVLSVKLKYLDHWTALRRAHAQTYNRLFQETGLATDQGTQCGKEGKPLCLPYEREGNYHVFHQYVVRAHKRDALRAFLIQHDIGCGIYYPLPIHLQPCYRDLQYREGSMPESERAAKEVLALPVFPELTEAQQERVVETIVQFYKRGI